MIRGRSPRRDQCTDAVLGACPATSGGDSDLHVEREQIPTQIRTYYTGPYFPSYGHYYGGNTITLVRPGYVDRTTTLVVVTTIFDAHTKEPVWVGHSKSVEPGSASYLADDIARCAWNSMTR